MYIKKTNSPYSRSAPRFLLLAFIFLVAGFTLAPQANANGQIVPILSQLLLNDESDPSGAMVGGRVTDITGVAVMSGKIEVYQDGKLVPISAEIDAKGVFSLSLEANTNYSLFVLAEGYAKQIVPVTSPAEGGQIALNIALIERGESIIISNDRRITHNGLNGASVTTSKQDFVNAAGEPVAGDIQLTITPVDVSRPASVAAFPGSFSGVQEGDSESSEIISLGTVEFEFTQDGVPVNLAHGKTANVFIPIYVSTYQDGTLVKVGDTIPLWSLDETTGIWAQEGMGRVIESSSTPTGLAMLATVSHFSWWNCDYVAEVAFVKITVAVAGSDSLAGNALITADTQGVVNWRGSASAAIGVATDALRIPSGQPVCFRADLRYGLNLSSTTAEKCVTAEVGEQLSLTLDSGVEGPLDIVALARGRVSDSLVVDGSVGVPFPIIITPLTVETEVSYALSNGALPSGLSIDVVDNQAVISGRPDTFGTSVFTITGTDKDGFTDSVTITYNVRESTLNVLASFQLPYLFSLSGPANVLAPTTKPIRVTAHKDLSLISYDGNWYEGELTLEPTVSEGIYNRLGFAAFPVGLSKTRFGVKKDPNSVAFRPLSNELGLSKFTIVVSDPKSGSEERIIYEINRVDEMTPPVLRSNSIYDYGDKEFDLNAVFSAEVGFDPDAVYLNIGSPVVTWEVVDPAGNARCSNVSLSSLPAGVTLSSAGILRFPDTVLDRTSTLVCLRATNSIGTDAVEISLRKE